MKKQNGVGSSVGRAPESENPGVAGSIPAPATNLSQPSDFELLRLHADPQDDIELHAFRWRKDLPPPAEIPLSAKMERLVWSGTLAHVIELPPDPHWLQREGYDMQHCLQYLHERYAFAMKRGEIRLFSMITVITGAPLVDIELAVTFGYGVPKRVDIPTVMQIRGFRNQCPPDKKLLPELGRFFTEYGKDWVIAPPYRNFDGKQDGKLFVEALTSSF